MRSQIVATTAQLGQSLFWVAMLWSGALGQVKVKCPPAPNQLTATVRAQVSFDAATQLYSYTYAVSNGAESAQEISSFSLDFAPPVSAFRNPRGWSHGVFRQRSTLGWAATAPVPLAPGAVDNGGLLPGFAQIKPGQSLGGFAFQSPKPPGPVKYSVAGFVQIPAQDDEEGAETLAEDCPQSIGNLLDMAVVGTTQGPVDFIPVNIAIKPTTTPPVPVNPRDQGMTPVAILGTATFDVTTVDQRSVRFGPASSTPQKDSAHFEDVNNDGIPDLVLQFPTRQVGVRCNDTALFLTGKTTSGTGIQGSETIHTVGCKF